MSRVETVGGDISEEGLGLSEDIYNQLCEQVTIVFHSAATVNFDENLKSSVRTNVKATKRIVSLCKLIQNLKVLLNH
jgi:fatty acyl-CoA reductase